MQRLAIAARCETSAPALGRRVNLVPQLRELAEKITVAIERGQTQQARRLVRQLTLPPIAWGFLASCLQKNHIAAETIEGVLS